MELAPARHGRRKLIGTLLPFLDDTPKGRDLTHVQIVLVVFTVFGLLIMRCFAEAGSGWKAVMWSLGVLATGTAVGFLFGVPKVRQPGAPRREVPPQPESKNPTPSAGAPVDQNNPTGTDQAPASRPSESQNDSDYQQFVNTNIEDVSDWLAKILIGVTLVEAKEIRAAIDPWLVQSATDIGLTGGTTVVGGAAVYFAVTGFFYGYLITRLFFAQAFRRADDPRP